MNVLLVGGSGTIGVETIPILLENPQIRRIRVFSRHEHRQATLAGWFKDRVDFLLGDIRDYQRLKMAMRDCTHVYHFAATKRVEMSENNPRECKSINIDGTENVINAVLDTPSVEKAMFTSTDKACQPLNFYGATKLVAERYWIHGNIGSPRAKFAVARYGNVLSSQGSVWETWSTSRDVTVCSGGFTRFLISPYDAAKFVTSSMSMMHGAETFVPKMKSVEIGKLADMFIELYGGNKKSIEARPGEKKHEVLISDDQVPLTTDVGDRFIQWPEHNFYPVEKHGQKIVGNFTSENAPRFTKEELETLCRSL